MRARIQVRRLGSRRQLVLGGQHGRQPPSWMTWEVIHPACIASLVTAATPAAPARVADAALLEAVRRPLEETRPEQLVDLAWAIAWGRRQRQRAGHILGHHTSQPVAGQARQCRNR